MKRFIYDFAGWKLIVNDKIVKLEKTPAEAKKFMGISEFEDVKDYCLLCSILIFLDDKYDGEQFLLSELIENIEKIISQTVDMDFTRFSDRKSLVRVLRFAQEKELVKISEGSLENVESNREKEILYENTGLSSYFSVHYDIDISEFTDYRDFENIEKSYSDNEKGYARTSRVYRRLLLQPAMYWKSKDDVDGVYVKNQRNTISGRLDRYLGGRLEIHNGSAFYMLSEEETFGKIHPSDKMIAGFTALLCGKIRTWPDIKKSDQMLCKSIEKEELYEFITETRKELSEGLSKEFREMTDDKLVDAVTAYMSDWMMIEETDDNFLICDGTFKTCGRYPRDF
jgi:uncharacterized protein (TIGR02678 family)